VIKQPRVNVRSRHDAAQTTLALDERQRTEVLTVDGQRIEGHEVRPLVTKHQIVELGAGVCRQGDNLVIDHARHRAHRVGNFCFEHRPLLVDVPAPGDERALMALDVRQCAKPVVFQFEHPVGMVERVRDPDQRHRPHTVGEQRATDGHVGRPKIARCRHCGHRGDLASITNGAITSDEGDVTILW